MNVCPECNGARMMNHPSLFEWKHEMSCSLLAKEDSRKDADMEVSAGFRTSKSFDRDVTEPERLLMQACGTALDADAFVVVGRMAAGVRTRRFFLGDGTPVEYDTPHPGVIVFREA